MSATEAPAATIRRYYAQWRKERGLSDRCDMPGCEFYSQPLIWNGAPLPLILDHISGNRADNLPTNLRCVCPNCNQQLPTTGGRNRGRISNRSADGYIVDNKDGTRLAISTGRATTANYENILALLEEELSFVEKFGTQEQVNAYLNVLPHVRSRAEAQRNAREERLKLDSEAAPAIDIDNDGGNNRDNANTTEPTT